MAKLALLIGVSNYEPGFSALPSAEQDIIAVQQVLENPEIGGFTVTTLLNPDRQVMEEAIELLFGNRSKDDLVLLFFSGHGIKDDRGRLYFATHRTRKTETGELMRTTAVSANFIHDIMGNSRAKRQVIVLDCCFSGAFASDMPAKAGQTEDITADIQTQLGQTQLGQTQLGQTQLGAEGRVVLTSSTATQYSFEANPSDSQLSVYTRYWTEGLRTGAADLDSDGIISVDELHEYARGKVQEAAPAMKPEIYAVREGYKIQLARAPVGDPALIYRKEVEELVHSNQGEIAYLDRRILDARRVELQLTPEVARTIEASVLQPYVERKQKLHDYEQAWREVVQRETTVSDATRIKLKRLQQILKLRDEDAAAIEAAIPLRKPEPSPVDSSASAPQLISQPIPTVVLSKNIFPSTQSNQPTRPPTSQNSASSTQPNQPNRLNLLPTRLNRQQFLKWVGFGGAGLMTAVVGREVLKKVMPPPISLKSFNFDVITVDASGKETNRRPGQAKFFEEDLGSGLLLTMVQIPGGSFKMGSPETEKDRQDSESSQRTVNVPGFFMGKFAITQAQYQTIMGNNPANFKGDQRPVETVSWDDAVAFCQKLSQQTGCTYRLPSEAEWEYACRAGTTTPFHFGETLTSQLANYDATVVYRSEPQGGARGQTTEVGKFPPNAFGLYDMHGNVWEWCADYWHENYQGAPSDGSAWLNSGNTANRVVRGGSWDLYPRNCRSASRYGNDAGGRFSGIGFRVVCSASRTS